MGDEKENILRELRNTGFPTEIKVTEYLKNKSGPRWPAPNKCYWSYINQQSYVDENENKIRSIDLCATVRYPKPYSFQSDEDSKTMKLYIECKKSDKAKWVFYTKPPSNYKIFAVRQWSEEKKYNPIYDVPDLYNTINTHICLTYQITFNILI